MARSEVDLGLILRTEDAEAWLTRVLPDGARATVREIAAEPPGEDLWPIEAEAVASAVEVRRREFAIGRGCARQAMAGLGRPPEAIPVGSDREPVWPDGLIGSITHTRRLAGAAVAPSGGGRSFGIDFEVAGRVDQSLVGQLLTARERDRYAAAPDATAPTVIFSAKEAIYKATFPLTRCWLGFEDVEVTLDLDGGLLIADVLSTVDHPMAGNRLYGFHRSMLGHVLTAVVL